jgi:CyaY protein
MDESLYLRLAEETFRKIQDGLEPLDPDVVDYDFQHDVLEITFADDARCILNTQRPARQIWMAWARQAWHFDWDEAKGCWLDDTGEGIELLGHLRGVIEQKAKVQPKF